jgi:hypothetical protein
MKSNKLFVFVAMFVLILSIIACSVDTGVATVVPFQPVATQQIFVPPTVAPQPTQVPPTAVPPAQHSSIVSALTANGFSFEANKIGGDGRHYATYRNAPLHMVALVYEDGSFAYMMYLGYDAKAQVKTTAAVILAAYGENVTMWVLDAGSKLTTMGQQIKGTVGNLALMMFIDTTNDGSPYEGIIIIPLTSGTGFEG